VNRLEPFRIAVPESRLRWIADRVTAYPWHAIPDAGGWTAGASVTFMRALADYWQEAYDWRAEEARLNRHPQYLARIGGRTLHVLHLKGRGERNTPLLLLHGWPGSIDEFSGLVDLLTSADDPGHAFDLVIPSLPGFGFSGALSAPIGPRAVAADMAALMRLLGYERYLAQGGDWGAMIATQLGIHDASTCIGIHLNMVVPGAAPESEEERAWAERAARVNAVEGGYSRLQMTRPQSLSFAMADSPVGTAAWIAEKFASWSDLPRDAQGNPDLLARYSRDQLLTNIMFYVAPDSFATSAWLYHGVFRHPEDMPFAGGARCAVPTAIAAFPDPVFAPPPRSLAEKSYDVIRWTAMPRGGHFAAMEAPELLAADIRAFADALAGRDQLESRAQVPAVPPARSTGSK